MSTLGTYKRKFVFSCAGIISAHTVHQFSEEFIRLAGMTPARPGRIDQYPYNGGGGVGYTAFFPLMESFLIIDVYTDLNESEITLSTCRPDRINLNALKNYLSCQVGDVKEVGTL